jgi:H+-transporting ATPase
MGIILAAGSWFTFGTMLLAGPNAGVVQNFGTCDSVLFLEISLTQNWLIFITRTNESFLSSRPSFLLVGAVLLVDIAASLLAIFGVFVGPPTSIVTVVRVWAFSLGVTVICAVLYYLLHNSSGFDNLMHGKSPRSHDKQRGWEDFCKCGILASQYRRLTELAVMSLQRVATQHEKTT